MPPLSVPSFGGGVVLEGAADTQRTDELQACDGYDIGARGALVAASDVAAYVTLNDLSISGVAGVPWTALHLLRSASGANYVREIAVGEGVSLAVAHLVYLLGFLDREAAASPVNGADQITPFGPPFGSVVTPTPRAEGCLVTMAHFSGVFKATDIPGTTKRLINAFLVNIGAREGFAPNLAPGLYVVYAIPGVTNQRPHAISKFDALGTGERGQFSYDNFPTTGTKGKQLYFRGVAAFNSFALGWGFDQSDATNGDGAARLMFSQTGKPLVWGNDNQGAGATDRDFTDSDAIIVGDVGERIRAGLTWNNRFWLGTNRALHFLAGYGRDSFLTDGANPIAKAENVVGPHALIEGPDKLLYGVGDQGLWGFDGGSFERHHKRLRDYAGHSLGFWDLIWNDRTRADAYPGKTNADLVWMTVDWDLEQVVVGIPWCSAANGYGYGTDTVVIKFHTRTGGFTRQVFAGVQYTAADYVRREGQFGTAKFLGTATAAQSTVKRYGYTAAPNASAPLPATLPTTTFGEYAQFGANGVGVYRKVYLTLAWESAASLPLVLTLTPSVDQQTLTASKLTISAGAPGAPADGDLWLDTSGTDTNLGNATAGTLIPAAADYVLKRWRASLAAWKLVPSAGQKGTRATVPIAITPTRGCRFKVQVAATSAAGRWQIEGLGDRPELVAEAA